MPENWISIIEICKDTNKKCYTCKNYILFIKVNHQSLSKDIIDL